MIARVAASRSSSGGEELMPAQQVSQTEPSSGERSGALHAAHGGSNSAARTALSDVRKFDASRAAPEAVEAVEVTRLPGEDVDDEVEIVEQHPFGAGVALHQ